MSVRPLFAYLDTSAFVKAPLGEPHAAVLAASADEWGMRTSSAVSYTHLTLPTKA